MQASIPRPRELSTRCSRTLEIRRTCEVADSASQHYETVPKVDRFLSGPAGYLPLQVGDVLPSGRPHATIRRLRTPCRRAPAAGSRSPSPPADGPCTRLSSSQRAWKTPGDLDGAAGSTSTGYAATTSSRQRARTARPASDPQRRGRFRPAWIRSAPRCAGGPAPGRRPG